MAIDRSGRRLPLRDLITDAEKRTRDLIEKIGTHWLSRVGDLRDLSRPVRKRSAYPTLVALHNAIEKLLETHAETAELLDYLTHELDEIRDHARREKMNRR
jgi:hypothetical protein